MPSKAEWASATRHSRGACSLWAVREWLKVSCTCFDRPHAFTYCTGFDVLGGGPVTELPGESDNDTTTLVMSVRRDDRRVIAIQSLFMYDHGYNGPALPATSAVVQVLWLPGEPTPTITVQ